MKNVWLKLFAALGATSAIGIATAGVAVLTGFIDVSADTPHSPLVYAAIDGMRELAIARQVRGITPPVELSDSKRVRLGAGNYAAMCANCHLAPGQPNSEIRKGLYPTPPDLTKAPSENLTTSKQSARRFWIIKHGIKASAMPAWSKGGMDDAAIWDLTAFLNRLPVLSNEQYRELVESSDGHAHAGMNDEHHDDADTSVHVDKPDAEPRSLAKDAPTHVDNPGAKPHSHEKDTR